MIEKCNKLVRRFSILSPIGKLNGETCDVGIHALNIDENSLLEVDENVVVNLCVGSPDENPEKQIVEWLQLYFKDPKLATDEKMPNICLFNERQSENNETFSMRVWDRLYKTKCGTTLSYSELASLCGNPKASRAVGNAMRSNPVVLLIPCHRVVKKDSGIGNYANGRSQIKQWLLNHERSVNK